MQSLVRKSLAVTTSRPEAAGGGRVAGLTVHPKEQDHGMHGGVGVVNDYPLSKKSV